MGLELDAVLEVGAEALRSGEWRAAAEAYGAALDVSESGDALFGLGIAHWWLGDTHQSLRCWQRAYTAFRGRHDHGPAVMAAVYLCLAYRMSLGNDAAAGGWLAKAAAVVDELELEPMRPWVLLCRAYAANDAHQPRVAEAFARESLALARQHGDADLGLCASSELGAALVGMGEVDAGLALLDQSMAAALAGEGGDLDTVVLVSCRTITACTRAADIKRAVQWVRAADDFHRRYGSTHLYTTCRAHHGSVLFAVGDWERAEAELHVALELGGDGEAALRAEATATLGELCIAQGRLEEADRLLAPYADHPTTACAQASLRLARGEAAAAAAILRRRLRDLEEACLEQARVLDLLTESEAMAAPADRAPGPASAAGGVASAPGVAGAHHQRALGRALVASGGGGAVEHLERALSIFGALEMPYESGRTRLVIARALAESDPETAIADARVALASFEDLGAGPAADAASAFLRSLGVHATRVGPKALGVLTKRELEVLALVREGLANSDIAARLFISRRTVEHHVASVLGKLGVTTRAAAAAVAADRLQGKSTEK